MHATSGQRGHEQLQLNAQRNLLANGRTVYDSSGAQCPSMEQPITSAEPVPVRNYSGNNNSGQRMRFDAMGPSAVTVNQNVCTDPRNARLNLRESVAPPGSYVNNNKLVKTSCNYMTRIVS